LSSKSLSLTPSPLYLMLEVSKEVHFSSISLSLRTQTLYSCKLTFFSMPQLQGSLFYLLLASAMGPHHLKVVTNEKGEAVGEVVTIIC
jgi:hypothetical protein